MSVLIKGMDAPNHPQKITIEFINEGQVITSVGNFEYCEVPTPHGALVDFDQLQPKWVEDVYGMHQEWFAPTVIESEE